MSKYESRHQPRHQTTNLGKVKNRVQYDIFYDIAYDAMLTGEFPSLTLPAGKLVLRVLHSNYDIEAARTIPPGSCRSTSNRFSGVRLDGRNGQGALYVGTVGGIMREHAHYSLQSYPASKLGHAVAAPKLYNPASPDRTRDFMKDQKTGGMPMSPQLFHLYRLKHPLQFADLRLTSLAPLFHRLKASGELKHRYGIVDHLPFDMLLSAACDAQDYSASRGIADAVFDRRHSTGNAGVCAHSTRADSDSGLYFDTHNDPTGGLIFAIFENDGTPVAALEPAVGIGGKPKDATFATFEAIVAAVG